AGLGIDRFDAGRGWRIVWLRCRSRTASPSDVLTSSLKGSGLADVLLAVLRISEIEPSGNGTIRRSLEIGASYQRRIHEETAFRAGVGSRNLNRTSVCVKTSVPVLIHECGSG